MTTKKPKIAYLIADATICGGIGVVCQHANRLARRGLEACIVSTVGDEEINWFPNQQVPVYPLSRIPSDLDIVVATWWETTHALYKLDIPRKFYFVQSDESRFYDKDRYERLFAHDSYWSDYEFITEARWIKSWLKEEFGQESHYVPNGVDLEIFHRVEPIEPRVGKPRILIEGPADMPSKGVADAFSTVSGLDCEVWYVNYRGKPDPEWKMDRYFYRVPMADMKGIYSSCDILLKLSSVEGSFGPPLEMMACGGICIVAETTGLEEAIVLGRNALVVKKGDIEGARIALKRLFEDKSLRQALVAAGHETVKRLDWESSINLLEGIYLSPAPSNERISRVFQEKKESEKEIAFIDAYSCMKRAEDNLNRKIQDLKREVNFKNDELNSIYLSKQWKIATAFKEARHSFKALLKLPFRIIRYIL